jgi:hypothetical protein
MAIIFLQEITNRARYIFEYLFEEILKVPIVLTSDLHVFNNSVQPKINYSLLPLDCPLKMYPHPILFQRTIVHQNLEPVPFEDELFFFASSADSFMPFDPFSASFYLVSRYEEYLMREFDEHCRYPSHHSILSCNHLLQKPVVNYWAQIIAQKVKEAYPDFTYRKPQFDFLSTIDIDNAWAYKNKTLWRTAGALAKGVLRGNMQHNKERIEVLRGRKADPYDTYSFIKDLYKGHDGLLQFFILLSKTSKYDRNISPKNKQLRRLVADLSSRYEVGIHPSYRSTKNPKELEQEIAYLQNISNKKVTASRQHFLRLVLPQTYRDLIKAGIKKDFTLGYANQVGFRAGTASPFWFYDLKKETKTKLRLHPFQMMDVSMKNSLKLTPEEAWEVIEKLMLEVRKYGGTFISLWHNESLTDQGEWTGWREIFIQMTALGIKYKNESIQN